MKWVRNFKRARELAVVRYFECFSNVGTEVEKSFEGAVWDFKEYQGFIEKIRNEKSVKRTGCSNAFSLF